MTSIAILVGVANYAHLTRLACCPTDVDAIQSLLSATKRFDHIHKIIDPDAVALKDSIRDIIKTDIKYQQIFFYFSGHGHSDGEDFHFCLKDFQEKRPNETGLSNRNLHEILREASPELLVKVIDACNSGPQLIKRGREFLPQDKGGLKNVVQIASCLDSQTSLTGEPLSEFTERFCRASARKEDGPVYYNDIISILRDEYLGDSERYPHFVFQASARETFVDDASLLSDFRSRFESIWASKPTLSAIIAVPVDMESSGKSVNLLNLLSEMEAEIAKPQDIPNLVNSLFDGLKQKVSGEIFKDFYDLEIKENSSLREPTTRAFITRILSQEKRNDEFVTASIKRERKINNRLRRFADPLMYALNSDDEYIENWELSLNIDMERAQIKLNFTPKFAALQQINLIVSCAPSLETCYVFELITRHPRADWNTFAEEGTEVIRRWYKLLWTEKPDSIIEKVADQISSTMKGHLESVAERLSKEKK